MYSARYYQRHGFLGLKQPSCCQKDIFIETIFNGIFCPENRHAAVFNGSTNRQATRPADVSLSTFRAHKHPHGHCPRFGTTTFASVTKHPRGSVPPRCVTATLSSVIKHPRGSLTTLWHYDFFICNKTSAWVTDHALALRLFHL